MHYYLYEFGTEEGDTGACIVEIYSDSAQSPGPEFTKVTLDQLHSLGYLTYQEQVALTPHYNIDLVSYVNGFIAASWAETLPGDQLRKYVWCGSKTIRPSSGPWYLDCLYRQIYNGQERIIGHYTLFARCGDGDIVSWRLHYLRERTKLHIVNGEHSFEWPPDAVIRTKATLLH
ncbi:MAG: hypothetical protein ABIK51_03695 [candidate division WOR-3 bacterium]